MGRKKQMELDVPWLDLEGKIASQVLHAPKTGGNPHGEWACVPDRVVGYFLRNVVGTPWADHLALIAAVLSARQRDQQTVRITIVALHARFTDLFAALGLKTINEWKNEVHLPLYLQGEIVPEDTLYTRHLFFRRYSSATRHVQSWLETLPDEERLCAILCIIWLFPEAYCADPLGFFPGFILQR
jgi:hypothetical protein